MEESKNLFDHLHLILREFKSFEEPKVVFVKYYVESFIKFAYMSNDPKFEGKFYELSGGLDFDDFISLTNFLPYIKSEWSQ
ncbi:9.7 kDa protein [Cordyline virus 4]|uniref:9.7 kDa protein n=1 Tax=Cordyline virus 4 TaxID=1177753 RepID=M1N1V6_9CLOS|nr:9.7 kDa protein [Cordyline virus 4]AGF73889.1 9.7 kDa protein [Cordyline virus 4]